MSNYKVVRYSINDYVVWNDFVSKAKNATFLFHRDFIEYHSDRFEDFSLLMYKDDKLVALLPANVMDREIYSHLGLSYGGLILLYKTAFKTVLESLTSALMFLSDYNFEKLILKQTPKIYLSKPSDELDYLMFILGAKLFRRDVSMAIKLDENIKYSTLRKREIKKAENLKLKFIDDDENFTSFWETILEPNLKDKFNVSPVHSLAEITKLKRKFPNKIRQFNVFEDNEILAGCTVFETKNVAHLQYISTNKKIKKGALDYLIHQLITDIYKDKVYFDFGISNENHGKNINLGLLNWKQSFGASSIVHDFYEIKVNNYPLLKDVLL